MYVSALCHIFTASVVKLPVRAYRRPCHASKAKRQRVRTPPNKRTIVSALGERSIWFKRSVCTVARDGDDRAAHDLISVALYVIKHGSCHPRLCSTVAVHDGVPPLLMDAVSWAALSLQLFFYSSTAS